MSGLFMLLFGLVGYWLLGVALAIGLIGNLRWREIAAGRGSLTAFRIELTGLGLILGIGATSWLQFVWSLLGGRLDRSFSIWLALISCCAGGLALCFHLVRSTSFQRSTNRSGDDSRHSVDALSRLCITVVLLLVVASIGLSLLRPQHLWDERSIYGIKALVLYFDGSIRSDDLMNPSFVQYHPRYPLLLPLTEQHIYALLGEANDRMAKLIGPILYAGMLFSFASVLMRNVPSARAWLLTAMLATIPALMPWQYGFISAQADAPVACFHTLSLLYLWDWLRSWSSPEADKPVSLRGVGLAGLAAALTVFSKDEGLAFVIVDACALAFIVVVHLRTSWSRGIAAVVLFCLVTVAVTVPWMIHRGRLPLTTEIGYSSRLSFKSLATGAGTIAWSLRHLLHRMFVECLDWGLQWWAMIAALMLGLGRALRPAQMLLLLDVIGALAAIVVAGMIAPTVVTEHLGGSSHRFLLQLAPATLLFVAGQFNDSAAVRAVDSRTS